MNPTEPEATTTRPHTPSATWWAASRPIGTDDSSNVGVVRTVRPRRRPRGRTERPPGRTYPAGAVPPNRTVPPSSRRGAPRGRSALSIDPVEDLHLIAEPLTSPKASVGQRLGGVRHGVTSVRAGGVTNRHPRAALGHDPSGRVRGHRAGDRSTCSRSRPGGSRRASVDHRRIDVPGPTRLNIPHGPKRGDGDQPIELRHTLEGYEWFASEGCDVIHDHTLVGPFLATATAPVITTNHGPFDNPELATIFSRLPEQSRSSRSRGVRHRSHPDSACTCPM